ncbi:uncharacterized protein LOC132402603 [Hypanus sabinus]|uniref:uncharacterized protein LOC132402603 n=1 Tax=Hypanus sabinus TaxID=79690 RepID=UPI0028C42E5C|nr:uncharacterized protein LOC132402603 [Hypanus sabinus]
MSSDCERYENRFRDLTLPPFINGISSILSLANSVTAFGSKELEVNESDQLKQDVEKAYTEMSKAEKEASGLINAMTTDSLQLAKDLDEAKRKRKSLEEELQEKKDLLIWLESQRYLINDQLQAARSNLHHTENTLNAAEARRGEKLTGRDMGLGLMLLVPCVGIPMAIDYSKELNSTKNLLKEVEKEKLRLDAEVKKNEEELKNCNSEIPERNKEIEKLKDNLMQMEREVEMMQKAFRALADTKTKLKYCHNYLSSLQGSVEVLYNFREDMYSLEPHMPLIEEIFNDIQQQNSQNELLVYDSRVQKVVKKLRAILKGKM